MKMRMTKQRKLILDIFEENKEPLSAEMIYNLLPNGSMNLSTIYRTIEKLGDLLIISKSIIDSTAYYYLTKGKHHHYLICINCKKMSETDCIIGQMVQQIKNTSGFKVINHDLTFYGYCSDCQNNQLS